MEKKTLNYFFSHWQAAKLKIQQSFIKLSLIQKLRRPSSEEKPANKSNMTNQVIEEEHLISTVNHSKIRAKKGGKETTISRPKVDSFPPSPTLGFTEEVKEFRVTKTLSPFGKNQSKYHRYKVNCQNERELQRKLKRFQCTIL